ncbi:MAG: DNA polymerase IV [Holophagales bacterium]|nr:DNA polymerase IV [Holophagales bacterium]
MGIRDSDPDPPIRRILHCDMDCFYAQVHMRDDASLRGKPVVIGGSPAGRGVVAAASYEAREFGIRSAMPAAQAVKRCPHAIFLKPEFPRYRAESERIFTILREMTPIVQPASLDEAYLDVSEHLEPWGSATAVAQEIRRRVREERRLTISVGVGPNRLIAKIASDYHKPDGLTVVRPKQVRRFLDPLPVRRLHGVGPATETRLHGLGVRTIADLRQRSLEELRSRFGSHGQGLWNYARGIDERPVRTHRERKSLGHERTYAEDLRGLEAMDAELERLSEMVAAGLAKKELLARTVTVKVRYPDFTTLTRSRTLPQPVAAGERISALARELLRQTEAGTRQNVRLLGVTASGLEHGHNVQLPLFDGV